MTDLDTRILQTAAGGLKCNPDEQRTYLTTFEERVIGLCSIAEANSSDLADHFQAILKELCQDYQPILVKIAPTIDSTKQIFYLKTSQDNGCEATIVAEDGASPFGLIIHSDHPVEVEEKELTNRFATLLAPSTAGKPEKTPFWKSLFKKESF